MGREVEREFDVKSMREEHNRQSDKNLQLIEYGVIVGG